MSIRSYDLDYMCLSCGLSKARRGKRGLCGSCYYYPEIRNLYPRLVKYTCDGGGNHCSSSLPLPEPTSALPGTPEKIAVLMERESMRQQLYHPADAKDPERYSARSGRFSISRKIPCKLLAEG